MRRRYFPAPELRGSTNAASPAIGDGEGSCDFGGFTIRSSDGCDTRAVPATEKAHAALTAVELTPRVARIEARRTAAQRRHRARRRRLVARRHRPSAHAGRVLVRHDDAPAVEPAARDSQRRVGADAPRRLARQRGGARLVHVARAEEGRPAAADAPDGRGRPGPAARNARCGYRPPRIAPVIRPALPGEGVWRSTERVVAGAPPVLVTTFRTDPDVPADRRLRRVVRPHAHRSSRSTPAATSRPTHSPRGPMEVPPGAALAAARDVQQRLHVPRRPRRLLRWTAARTTPLSTGHGDDRRLQGRPRRRRHVARRTRVPGRASSSPARTCR